MKPRGLVAGFGTAMAALLLAACGGGDSSPAPGPTPPPVAGPSIQSFAATQGPLYIGDRPVLTALFSGGQARVDPGIGPVSSGVPFSAPVLDRMLRLSLHVEATGQATATRMLELVPQYRDRYQPLAGALGVQAHAAVPLPEGGLVIVGGSRGGPFFSAGVEVFDPETRRFVTVAQLADARIAHQAVRVSGGPRDGQILVAGGMQSLELDLPAELVDLRGAGSTPVGRLVQPRLEHAMLALPDGRVLVVGGLGRDTLEVWDPVSGEFRLVQARMRHARAAPAVALLNDGRVLIAGGIHGDAVHVPAELFDPQSERFSPVVTSLQERRYGDHAHRLADGRVLLLGGERPVPGGLPFTDGEPTDSVLSFDPASNVLVRAQGLDTPRSRMASVLLPDDTLLLFGGRTATQPATSDALHLRAAGHAPVASLPNARRMATAQRLPDGRVLIVGGDDGGERSIESILLYE